MYMKFGKIFVKMEFAHSIWTLMITLAVCNVRVKSEDWKKEIEYFESVDLHCNEFHKESDGVIQSVQAWILPSGQVWHPGMTLSGKHINVLDNGFVLRINWLDDDDFGVYYCIVDTGTNGTRVIRVGVNVDGPYFGPTYMNEIKRSAKVGGIAAGCALIILLSIWLLCAKCKCNPMLNPSNEQQPGDLGMTKLDGNIYYNADSKPIESANGPAKTETLSSYNSGHYHSIGSLDRSGQVSVVLENKEPSEIYNKYVESVHQGATVSPIRKPDEEQLVVNDNEISQCYENPAADFTSMDDMYAKPTKHEATVEIEQTAIGTNGNHTEEYQNGILTDTDMRGDEHRF